MTILSTKYLRRLHPWTSWLFPRISICTFPPRNWIIWFYSKWGHIWVGFNVIIELNWGVLVLKNLNIQLKTRGKNNWMGSTSRTIFQPKLNENKPGSHLIQSSIWWIKPPRVGSPRWRNALAWLGLRVGTHRLDPDRGEPQVRLPPTRFFCLPARKRTVDGQDLQELPEWRRHIANLKTADWLLGYLTSVNH